MAQLDFETIVNNRNLFSNHYLEDLIQRRPEWTEKDHQAAFREIKEIYQEEKPRLEALNEAQLEKSFFRKIFKVLLPDFEVQAVTETQEFPDYAFFSSKQTLADAHQRKGTKSFYVNAFAVGEVKKWDIELDRFGRDKHDKRRNPSFQIWLYLHETEPKWGILSNGRKWRLYHQDKPLDCYYEVDLATMLDEDAVEGFKYFYYFFRKEAFLPSEDGEIFLEEVLKESADYAREIGDNLKENVYKAMKRIADGLFGWPQNRLDSGNETTRLEVQKSTMRLLYRLLFLLYAEGKGLLSLRNEEYRNTHSLDRLKKEIKSKKDGPAIEYYSSATTTLWSRLKDLFRLIDQGSESFGIPEEHFCVPAYNGGLFDPRRNPNLERWTIGDIHLADAVDLLARSGTVEGFVDYSTLDIRHLGSIYEGLFEYKLRISEKDMVVKGGEKKREWVTLEEFNKNRKRAKRFVDFDEFDRVKAGNLYLATDRGERKATGSFYTPDYVVNYIVRNTLGPILVEKWEIAIEEERSLVEATLSTKVLDPAMGSGHFLVGAIEFLAEKLLEAAQEDIEAGLVEDDGHFSPDWAKREVLSHCIYGVDLNELAVELAKVSLWLTTISGDKPLSFLDYRLRQGNCLIGATLSDLSRFPKSGGKPNRTAEDVVSADHTPFIDKLLESVEKLEFIKDDTTEQVREKERIFTELRNTLEYRKIKSLADLNLSILLGNEIVQEDIKKSAILYADFTNHVFYGGEQEWNEYKRRSWVKRAWAVADEKAFFHWELEFPEIFFEKGSPKENPGFDAVIGNPPYIDSELMSKTVPDERDFIARSFETAKGNWDLYIPFWERSVLSLKRGGNASLITPNKWLSIGYGKKLREFMEQRMYRIADFSTIKVFEDSSIFPVVAFASHDRPSSSIKVQIYRDDYNLVHEFDVLKSFLDRFANFGILFSTNIALVDKILRNTVPISDIFSVEEAFTVSEAYDLTDFIVDVEQPRIGDLKFIITGTIDRYTSLWGFSPTRYVKKVYHRPIVKDNDLRNYSERRYQQATSRKIILSGIRHFEAFLDSDAEFLAGKSTVILRDGTGKFKLETLLAVLNSKVMKFYIRQVYGALSMDGGINFTAPLVRELPIPKIDFDSSDPDRAEELIALYQSSNHEGVLSQVKGLADDSAVLHDILSPLAARMMEMNSRKIEEAREFLEWFEMEIRTKIETLQNRTKLMTYYNLDFEELVDILKQNRENLSINPSNREFLENLEREFKKSIEVLSPLRDRIQVTDELIDNIVYKLFGLKEEDIKIIDQSVQ